MTNVMHLLPTNVVALQLRSHWAYQWRGLTETPL
jgi:hypothetical protein